MIVFADWIHWLWSYSRETWVGSTLDWRITRPSPWWNCEYYVHQVPLTTNRITTSTHIPSVCWWTSCYLPHPKDWESNDRLLMGSLWSLILSRGTPVSDLRSFPGATPVLSGGTPPPTRTGVSPRKDQGTETTDRKDSTTIFRPPLSPTPHWPAHGPSLPD